MSIAFMKEPDGEVFDDLPDRPVSPHRNLVTPEGLAMIDAEITRLHAEMTHAQEAADRSATARANRDLRYWQARRASAELVPAMPDKTKVHFGSAVTIRYEDGRQVTFRIVGEDEADPAKGTISYVSPMGRALTSKEVGEVVSAGAGEVEVVKID
ncbi:MAG: transcription elongation factor GreA [Beijerinckiaceae bacterium]|jgi:transcription elongation GreA/GreB family factor|nr:transcription elongation factor GreA [Beijerinckiaceae bacterium]MDO9443414.1 transcription elongation factor GreA [Beijerinckiaceae bacterium]